MLAWTAFEAHSRAAFPHGKNNEDAEADLESQSTQHRAEPDGLAVRRQQDGDTQDGHHSPDAPQHVDPRVLLSADPVVRTTRLNLAPDKPDPADKPEGAMATATC